MTVIIGHRGVRGRTSLDEPEIKDNSIPGLQKAEKLGADGVEFDVHQTLDGHLILFHDDFINDTLIDKYPLEEMLKREKVARLDDALDFLKGTSLFMDVELKMTVDPELIYKTFLDQKIDTDQFHFTSFEFRTLRTLETLGLTKIRRALNLGPENVVPFLNPDILKAQIEVLDIYQIHPRVDYFYSRDFGEDFFRSVALENNLSIWLFGLKKGSFTEVFMEDEIVDGVITDDIPGAIEARRVLAKKGSE